MDLKHWIMNEMPGEPDCSYTVDIKNPFMEPKFKLMNCDKTAAYIRTEQFQKFIEPLGYEYIRSGYDHQRQFHDATHLVYSLSGVAQFKLFNLEQLETLISFFMETPCKILTNFGPTCSHHNEHGEIMMAYPDVSPFRMTYTEREYGEKDKFYHYPKTITGTFLAIPEPIALQLKMQGKFRF